jgi:rhodanese-related sulfurtransferase
MKELLSRLLAAVLPAPPEIGPGEDVVFVDVRTPGEYAAGHVAGARLIPHHEMERRWKELRDQRKKRILVYCRTGSRSRVATQVLRSKGFDRAENAGGMGGLRRAGVEIELP